MEKEGEGERMKRSVIIGWQAKEGSAVKVLNIVKGDGCVG